MADGINLVDGDSSELTYTDTSTVYIMAGSQRVICPTHGDIGSVGGLDTESTLYFPPENLRICTHCWADWMRENVPHGLCAVQEVSE